MEIDFGFMPHSKSDMSFSLPPRLPRRLWLLPSLLGVLLLHRNQHHPHHRSLVAAAARPPWGSLADDPLARWGGGWGGSPRPRPPLKPRRGRSLSADAGSDDTGVALAEGHCASVSKALCDVILTTPLGTGPCSEAAVELNGHPMAALFTDQFLDKCCVDSCATECNGRSGETSSPYTTDNTRIGPASCTATAQDEAKIITYAPCEFPIHASEPFLVSALGSAEKPPPPPATDGDETYMRNRWDYYRVMTEFGYTDHSVDSNNRPSGVMLQTFANGYHALGHSTCWVSNLRNLPRVICLCYSYNQKLINFKTLG